MIEEKAETKLDPKAKKSTIGIEVKVRKTPRQKLYFSLIILSSILAFILVTLLLLNRFMFVKPELPSHQQFIPPMPASPSTDISPSPGTPVDDYDEGIRPKSSGDRKSKDFYTILVLGRDTGGGGNTDTILLASYDVTNQRATVMSIPRDTMVNVPWDVKKLNSVYNWYGGGENGIQKVYQEISQLVGFEPDYRIIVEWDAIGEITDAIGGIYFDVPYNMDYDDPNQNLHIHQEKGYRLLSGDDAMQVIRWRMNNSNSIYGSSSIGDFGRMNLQQDFLKAVTEQLLTVENIGNISKIADVFKKNVITDLSFQNILWFGRQALLGGLSADQVTFVTMPLQGAYAWSTSYQINLSYVCPIGDQLLNLVNNQLSPYSVEFSLSDLDIMSVNEDGSVSSSTGTVLDTNATFPYSHWNPPVEDKKNTSVEDSGKELSSGQDNSSESSSVSSSNTSVEKIENQTNESTDFPSTNSTIEQAAGNQSPVPVSPTA